MTIYLDRIEAMMFLDGAFWFERSFHAWFQGPYARFRPFKPGCPLCGEDPCKWGCEEYVIEAAGEKAWDEIAAG